MRFAPLLLLIALLSAADREEFTLRDGRKLVGAYDEQTQTMRIDGGSFSLKPGDIVQRGPAPPAEPKQLRTVSEPPTPEPEQFTLKDGRVFTGIYNEQTHTVAVGNGGQIPVKLDDIVKREPRPTQKPVAPATSPDELPLAVLKKLGGDFEKIRKEQNEKAIEELFLAMKKIDTAQIPGEKITHPHKQGWEDVEIDRLNNRLFMLQGIKNQYIKPGALSDTLWPISAKAKMVGEMLVPMRSDGGYFEGYYAKYKLGIEPTSEKK